MKNYSEKFNNIYFSIFSIAFLYFLLFTSFYLVCFLDKNGLYKLIIEYKTYENLPFSIDDTSLKTLASELMEYISGKLLFLETKVPINGIITDFYSIRSKIHMADVRNIIVTLKNVNYVSMLLCIISLFKIINTENVIIKLKKIYIRTTIIITAALIIIFAFGLINFDSFFIKFHELLFTNDLWLLDPSEDYIICLLPEKIFMTYGLRIVIAMIVSILFSVGLLQILSKIQLRQEAK